LSMGKILLHQTSSEMFIFQVGNAVPPPMGKVLGLEIRKAMAEAEQKKKSGGLKLEAVEAAA
jgi:hypothetical protein